jgi:predicted transcriptional regulator
MSIPGWTFLANHAHVLVCINRDPTATMRGIAEQVGITERAVQRIVAELVVGGYLERRREGRRNVYVINRDRPLRHPLESSTSVAALLNLIDS